MTLRRLMLLGALGMLVSGFAVYTLATPPGAPQASNDLAPVAPTTSEPRPAPTPNDTAPAPSTSLPSPTSPPPAPHPHPTRTTPTPSPTPSGTTTISPAEASSVVALLRVLASLEVAGMTPEGTPTIGRLTQGQALEREVTLHPGKCYAALGALLNEGEIDIFLIGSIPGYPPATIATDHLTGPAASAGGKGACLKWTYATAPGRFVLRAVKGGGVVAGQLYVK